MSNLSPLLIEEIRNNVWNSNISLVPSKVHPNGLTDGQDTQSLDRVREIDCERGSNSLGHPLLTKNPHTRDTGNGNPKHPGTRKSVALSLFGLPSQRWKRMKSVCSVWVSEWEMCQGWGFAKHAVVHLFFWKIVIGSKQNQRVLVKFSSCRVILHGEFLSAVFKICDFSETMAVCWDGSQKASACFGKVFSWHAQTSSLPLIFCNLNKACCVFEFKTTFCGKQFLKNWFAKAQLAMQHFFASKVLAFDGNSNKHGKHTKCEWKISTVEFVNFVKFFKQRWNTCGCHWKFHCSWLLVDLDAFCFSKHAANLPSKPAAMFSTNELVWLLSESCGQKERENGKRKWKSVTYWSWQKCKQVFTEGTRNQSIWVLQRQLSFFPQDRKHAVGQLQSCWFEASLILNLICGTE